MLPGGHAYAFDLSGSLDAGSWYATLVQGVFNIMVTMTWLQVIGYALYLALVMTLFVRGVRATAPKPEAVATTTESVESAESAESAGTESAETESAEAEPAGTEAEPTPRQRPRWLVPTTLVAVPAVLAGVVIAVSDGKPAAAATVSVSESKDQCGKGFSAPQPGQQTFQMHNTGSKTSEVYLVNPSTNAVYGEVEGLAPAPPAR